MTCDWRGPFTLGAIVGLTGGITLCALRVPDVWRRMKRWAREQGEDWKQLPPHWRPDARTLTK